MLHCLLATHRHSDEAISSSQLVLHNTSFPASPAVFQVWQEQEGRHKATNEAAKVGEVRHVLPISLHNTTISGTSNAGKPLDTATNKDASHFCASQCNLPTCRQTRCKSSTKQVQYGNNRHCRQIMLSGGQRIQRVHKALA